MIGDDEWLGWVWKEEGRAAGGHPFLACIIASLVSAPRRGEVDFSVQERNPVTSRKMFHNRELV